MEDQDRRRLAGIPTVSLLVANDEQTAIAVAFEFTELRGTPLLLCKSDVAATARRWFIDALTGSDPLMLIAQPIATKLKTSVSGILNRLHDDARLSLPGEYRAALPSTPEIETLLEALGANDTTEEIWDRAQARAIANGIEAQTLIACTIDLMRPNRGPAILYAATEPSELIRAARVATALVEAAPTLSIIIASDEASYEIGIESGRSEHATDLLREAMIRVAPQALSRERSVAAMLDEARALGNQVSDDESTSDKARSAAERTLFAALEAHPVTRGCFELNGKLRVYFGSRYAEIDLLARLERIALEVDGYHHFRDADCYRRDRRKDVLLQNEGYFVLRTLAEDVVENLDQTVASIAAIVGPRKQHAFKGKHEH